MHVVFAEAQADGSVRASRVQFVRLRMSAVVAICGYIRITEEPGLRADRRDVSSSLGIATPHHRRAVPAIDARVENRIVRARRPAQTIRREVNNRPVLDAD